MIFVHAIVDAAPKVLGMGAFFGIVALATTLNERRIQRRENARVLRMFAGNRQADVNVPSAYMERAVARQMSANAARRSGEMGRAAKESAVGRATKAPNARATHLT